jgi:uncharacterized protein (DUF1786 family)
MQILAVDIGTGTQDILLYDTNKEPENALQMILPAPTQIVARAIQQATQAGEDILLIGATMGGGPCAWAARQHIKAGRRVYATPAAARTFDDDLTEVAEMGVQIIGEDEMRALRDVRRLILRDLDMAAIRAAFGAFGVEVRPAAIGVAVFDHGAAPPGWSDRRFRFEYLTRRLQAEPTLTALAFMADKVPPQMTRMAAIAAQAEAGVPLLLMDTPSAAVLGALEDPVVRRAGDGIFANIGNAHTLAFRLQGGRVSGLFEHHTGRLTTERLDNWLEALAAGTISNDAVFEDQGHGALLLDPQPMPLRFLSVTGPRRMLLYGSRHAPYFAVPYGDMMVAGCWGLIRALTVQAPELAEAVKLPAGDTR